MTDLHAIVVAPEMIATPAEDEVSTQPASASGVSMPRQQRPTGQELATPMNVQLPCFFELGGTRLSVSEVPNLRSGTVVLLDQVMGEPGRLMVAGEEFAEAEVVAVAGGYYGIRITRLIADVSPHVGS